MDAECRNSARKIAGVRSLRMKFEESKGRYLTAGKFFRLGDLILSDEAFSGILTVRTRDGWRFCSHCFKRVIGKGEKCFGCSEALYCNESCKRLAWKSNHWMECCMGELLNQIGNEVKMALRILLNAAHTIFHEKVQCRPLHLIAEDMKRSAKRTDGCTTDCNGNNEEYEGCYWSIYCLQTHANQPVISESCKKISLEVQYVTDFLLTCFSSYTAILEGGNASSFSCISDKSMKTPMPGLDLLLHSFFRKLSFSSYYGDDRFSIESFRIHVQSSCKSLKKQSDKGGSLHGTLLKQPVTQRDVCQRLLLHHALQLQSNAQAIFEVCETLEHSATGSAATKLSQIRIATAVFPITSLMNHSCSPNTTVNFVGRKIRVVAAKSIQKKEEILHCYGPHYKRHKAEERQKMLKDQYFFTCDCKKCSSETSEEEDLRSFDLQFRAFKCSYCGEPLQNNERKFHGKQSVDASCINVNCGKTQDISSACRIYQNSKDIQSEACNLLGNGCVEASRLKYEACLKEMESVLYRNNYEIGEVHDQIAHCYVLQEKYTFAIQHLCKSITLVGMLHGAQSVELAQELQKLATVYFNSGDFGNALKIARKSITIYKIYFPETECNPPGMEEMKHIVMLCC